MVTILSVPSFWKLNIKSKIKSCGSQFTWLCPNPNFFKDCLGILLFGNLGNLREHTYISLTIFEDTEQPRSELRNVKVKDKIFEELVIVYQVTSLTVKGGRWAFLKQTSAEKPCLWHRVLKWAARKPLKNQSFKKFSILSLGIKSFMTGRVSQFIQHFSKFKSTLKVK